MCEGDGTVLATITDGFQQAFLETQLFKNGEESLWTGLLNDQVKGDNFLAKYISSSLFPFLNMLISITNSFHANGRA